MCVLVSSRMLEWGRWSIVFMSRLRSKVVLLCLVFGRWFMPFGMLGRSIVLFRSMSRWSIVRLVQNGPRRSNLRLGCCQSGRLVVLLRAMHG